MKRIIYQTIDGGVAVIVPSFNWGGTIEELAAKDVPTGRPYKIVDASEVPSDRIFRNAWEWREARKPLLTSLDIEFMKAVEAGDSSKQAEIASQKQALRDVTQTPIPGTTTEEIKSVWPSVLG